MLSITSIAENIRGCKIGLEEHFHENSTVISKHTAFVTTQKLSTPQEEKP